MSDGDKKRDQKDRQLMAAVMEGNLTKIEALIKDGADVNARGRETETPLILALMYNNNPTVIETLAKAGADVEARFEGVTPLMIAIQAKQANLPVIEALIKAGADVNARCEESEKRTDEKSPFQSGRTPLMIAAGKNKNPVRMDIIKMLVKAGADVNAKDDIGLTPLMISSAYGRDPAVVETLLDLGADADTRDPIWRLFFYDIGRDNSIRYTPAYWRMYDLKFK